MISLFKKEIRSFFNSLMGYLVISVFLILNSLFLWIIPNNGFNLMDSGYASIDGLFMIAPWVFMFLIPAITMRMFADEKKAGTMEFLLTKPLTEIQVLVAKFAAALALVLFSLLPTLLYYYSIYELGDPVGNIDSGATMGSYIGLILIAGAYTAIGLFASSNTDNQIISFIVAAVISFLFYTGFDQVAELDIFGDLDLFIYNLGINEHYLSISRGVVDSRDVLYFAGLIVFFGALARLVVQSRKWDKSTRRNDLIQFGLLTAMVLLLNIAGSFEYMRLDLTAEKRYSLNEATIDLLDQVEDPLLFRVYLEGDFPADIQRLELETKQMLDEFRAHNGMIEYEFINPNESESDDDRVTFAQQLQQRGLTPFTIQEANQDGQSTQQIFPGAIVSYQNAETAINLLQTQIMQSNSTQVNNSVQNLEYNLASALRRLILKEKPTIGFMEGHGELEAKHVASIAADLSGTYSLSRFNIREFQVDSITGKISIVDQMRRINRFDLLIIAKPQTPFVDVDRFLIDQYIMNGGKVIWMVDAVKAEMDSLSYASEFLGIPTLDKLNIDDMLFTYGVRLNTVLLQDIMCAMVNDRRQLRPWPYFPIIMPRVKHPITKDLNAVKLEFAGTIDTIFSPRVKKTPLLVSSENSKAQAMPGLVGLKSLYTDANPAEFRQQYLPVAYLLEGEFESVYRHRLLPRTAELAQLKLKNTSSWTQQVVIADGDIIKNQLNVIDPNIPRGTPLKLGYDQYIPVQYGNDDFMLNVVDYLLDESGLISVRSRELKIRLLNSVEIKNSRTYWAVLNTVAPILFIILFGVLYTWNRKRKYAIKA
ncbi:MAG: gliding motility-associated ABC transporter substrate-binding protein GldG [Bacteroidetes bacterium]|nr:MAG: gliding motility-associated ABC transporter substrate-binding protein GldG [Bacteroidota bacterium]